MLPERKLVLVTLRGHVSHLRLLSSQETIGGDVVKVRSTPREAGISAVEIGW